jgi:hypothetical protein
MKRFEYKHIRLDYKGRGITQEINLLDIDGQRIKGWGSSSNVPTLPEMFAALGKDGQSGQYCQWRHIPLLQLQTRDRLRRTPSFLAA